MKKDELIRLIKLKLKACREHQMRILNELNALNSKGILNITKESELRMTKDIVLGNMQAYFDILNILSYDIVEDKKNMSKKILIRLKGRLRRIRDNLISSVETIEYYNKKDYGLRFYIGELYEVLMEIDKEMNK